MEKLWQVIVENSEFIIPIITGAVVWLGTIISSSLERRSNHKYQLKEKKIEAKINHSNFTKQFTFEVKYPIYQELYDSYKKAIGTLIALEKDIIEPSTDDLDKIYLFIRNHGYDLRNLTQDEFDMEVYNYYIDCFFSRKKEMNHLISRNNLIFDKHENTVLFNTFMRVEDAGNFIISNIEKVKATKELKVEDYHKMFIKNEDLKKHISILDNHMYGIAELFKISLSLHWKEDEDPISIEQVYKNLGIPKDTN